jgi:ferrous iron transport protein B
MLLLLRNSWNRLKHFVTKAGKITFAVTVVIWILGTTVWG